MKASFECEEFTVTVNDPAHPAMSPNSESPVEFDAVVQLLSRLIQKMEMPRVLMLMASVMVDLNDCEVCYDGVAYPDEATALLNAARDYISAWEKHDIELGIR